MRPSLVDLGKIHHTDKGTRHTYLEVYDRLLLRHRDAAANVLEIGCLDGDSLRLWEAYFTKAAIVGLDINPCRVSGDRIAFHQCDAYDVQTVAGVCRPCDVVIDDGPHTRVSMLFAVQHYSRVLAPGGTLIVEDVWKPERLQLLAEAVPDHLKRFAYAINRNHVPGSNSGDDMLFVIDLPDHISGAK